MSVASVEGKTAPGSSVSDVAWEDGVALTPAQIHAAHRRALRQAGGRLRGRSGRADEPNAMARPGAPSGAKAGQIGPVRV